MDRVRNGQAPICLRVGHRVLQGIRAFVQCELESLHQRHLHYNAIQKEETHYESNYNPKALPVGWTLKWANLSEVSSSLVSRKLSWWAKCPATVDQWGERRTWSQ